MDNRTLAVSPSADRGLGRAGALAGSSVLLVHPAWHSCGSYKVFLAQARAYRALGARLIALAIADSPLQTQASYFAATGDLEADTRCFAGLAPRRVLSPALLRAGMDWLHGNYATMLVELARRVSLPAEVLDEPRIDLVHCNHFFCMPAALSARGGRACRIVLDTHDLQAAQFKFRQAAFPTVPPRASYETMLGIELAAMRGADLLVHLNAEEAAIFERLLPEKKHALVFPSVEPVKAGRGGADIIIVASANYPNFRGLSWFLEEVAPRLGGVPVKIIGNIDREFRRRAPRLFREYAAIFQGYAEDLNEAYGRSAAVLLPATEGYGISIKTIEALSSGAPLIATPLAFRGMGIDPASLSNVTLASDAAAFAAAIRAVAEESRTPSEDRMTSDTRRLYERLFSPAAYREALAARALPLLETPAREADDAS